MGLAIALLQLMYRFSDSRDPVLAAGPNSALRADPDPAVAVSPDDRHVM